MEHSQPRRQWRWLSPLALVLAAAVGIVCAAWAVVAYASDGWLGGALRDPMTVRHGGIALGSLVVLYLLAALMWRMGRARKRSAGSDGTAAIEFVLVFPIAMVVALVMIQSMLVAAGNVVVHYAGYAAARAAIVHVPANLSYDEPRNVVADPGISEKLHRIRMAAVEAVKGVSAGKRGAWGAGGDGGDVLREGYDRFYALSNRKTPKWVHTMLAGKWEYALAYTRVDLVDPAEDEEDEDLNVPKYGDHEDLTVTVRHELYLSVPIAKHVFGRPLVGGSGYDYATATSATYTLTNQGQEDQIDVEVFPRYVGRGSN